MTNQETGIAQDTFISPARDLGSGLLNVEKPARYLGGELGSNPRIEPGDVRYRAVICFPDLYEIGMSNNAIRIIYEGINRNCPEVACERVFAPAPDFEALLRAGGVPLFTLESGIPLRDCDLLGFSIGYELLATNIVTVLEAGRIPVRARDRLDSDPIVIAGGPAVSNPLPYSIFLDAVYIGEAEGGFYETLSTLAAMKARGASRAELLSALGTDRHFWMPASQRPALRAIQEDFAHREQHATFPVPILKTVQDHGTVEIMRGCPNGCRFCHAGYYYRPQRVKGVEIIDAEVENLVRNGGYREITLSSLSSGDYPGIHELIRHLNARWAGEGISFQLPSLKVDSFTLPLLDELSEVRKSGLTFAVETPVESWQGSINKIVSFEKTVEILKEAKARGFRQAKFYFMIGLPVPGRGPGEAEAILEFLGRISKEERISLSVNVGTFVPKPHTPYERERQISEEESLETIRMLRDGLRPYRFIKLSFHSPFTSMLEGVIARGDERVGELVLEAWKRGARLDAWDEHFDRERWREVFADSGWNPQEACLSGFADDAVLPWNGIRIMVSDSFLEIERGKSKASELTGACSETCDHFCGACRDKEGIEASPSVRDTIQHKDEPAGVASRETTEDPIDMQRLILRFRKSGNAVYYPMHSVSGAFARAFLMREIPVKFSEGFNPLPKIELTPPLPLGAASESEILSLWLTKALSNIEIDNLIESLSACLPAGISILGYRLGLSKSHGKRSIGSMYAGSVYRIRSRGGDDIFRLKEYLVETGVGTVLEGDALWIDVALDDSHGGEKNISRILEKISAARPVLGDFSLIRREAYVHSDDGSRIGLFESL